MQVQLNLSAARASSKIALHINSKVGLRLKSTNATAAGTLTFRLCNTTEDTSPQPLNNPQVTVVAGTAIDHYVELVNIVAPFIDVYWTPSVGEDVVMTIDVALKQ
jgi:hypothetical protein